MEEEYLKHLAQVGAEDIEQLVRRYWKDVWHFAYVMTKQRDMADDIAQETFIRAFRSLHAFRGESTVKTWLLRIAKHLSINHRRSAFFRHIVLLDQVRHRRSSPSAEADYFEGEFADRIWTLVLRLPAKQREVLLLHAHYQLKPEETANVLGLPQGTVKSRLHRARTQIDKWLKEADAIDSE
ncbi:RNA polymerase sigma factor [Paenibacillus lycopersici]|uniref:RNA polymerase sigma factor n=1 Tax=Paenibacillus lycopersici TaxID=2704462 RepID=A0A6C0G4K5_9BACL|nr:RNA polymerase sigma factor [Paenibacillus lycopersici]QHT62414.1 RNA polymerase sigma factor [Paenibacillus lycopersici]